MCGCETRVRSSDAHHELDDACCCCCCHQLEKAQKDPARVQLLYERAVAVFPVTSELWLQYTKYLETELKVPALVNRVRQGRRHADVKVADGVAT